jgi:hypothetical protein
MILFLLACGIQADELALEESTEVVQIENTDIPQHPEDRSKEQIMVDMLSIELYLTDKKNYKLYCQEIKWEQPPIKIYKKELVSQLPAKCQAKIPEPEPTEEEK